MELQGQDWETANHYAEAKSPLIAEMTARAERWAAGTGWSPRSMRERILAGELYIADEWAAEEHRRAMVLVEEINRSPEGDPALRRRLFAQLLGSFGEGAEIRPPFYCDYGWQTHVGARTFANFGLTVLDVATVTIGEDVQIGPHVQLLTATHPLEAEPRRAKWESATPVVVDDNVWLGGGVIVCPGVTIGRSTVVGAGAVVTKDLPPHVLAVGSPARPIRSLPGDGPR
jgi:maltose O-acetyltransferase